MDDRITSYNVCYTKLLRLPGHLPFRAAQRRGAVAGGEGGEDLGQDVPGAGGEVEPRQALRLDPGRLGALLAVGGQLEAQGGGPVVEDDEVVVAGADSYNFV